MTKGSTWRRFCCTCSNNQDDNAMETPYVAPRRQGPISRVKSAKSTWARRSLLENEQSTAGDNGYHFPIELMAYQMRSIETPTNIPRTFDEDDDYDVRRRIASTTQYRQRQSVKGTFEATSTPRPNAPDFKTTFPWMDEEFSPRTPRSGTRLGVRSLQMNARRNDLQELGINIERSRTSGSDVGPSSIPTTKHAFQPYVKSQSFTEGASEGYFSPHRGAIHPTHQTQTRYFPYANHPNDLTTRSYIHYQAPMSVPKPDLPKTAIPRPPPTAIATQNAHHTDRPQVLRSPKSNISVRNLTMNNEQQPHERPIPKLDDSPISSSRLGDVNGHSNAMGRVSVMDMFPRLEDCGASGRNLDKPWDCNGEISFSSDFTLRKAPSDVENDGTVQKSSHPRMFPGKSSKHERLKAHSTKGKGNKKPDLKSKNNGRAESMYGYVPKVVQDVHASTVLEGTQIDDFFRMQAKRNHRPTSRNSISEDMNYIILSSESDDDDDAFIVSTDPEEPKETQKEPKAYKELQSQQSMESLPEEDTRELQRALTNSRSVATKVAICDPKYAHKALEHDIDQVFMNLNLEKAARASGETYSKNFYNTQVESGLESREDFSKKYQINGHVENVHDPCVYDNRDDHTITNVQDVNDPDSNQREPNSACHEPFTIVNGYDRTIVSDKIGPTENGETEVIMIDFPPNVESDRSSFVSNVSRKTSSRICNTSDVSSKSSITAQPVIKHDEFLY